MRPRRAKTSLILLLLTLVFGIVADCGLLADVKAEDKAESKAEDKAKDQPKQHDTL